MLFRSRVAVLTDTKSDYSKGLAKFFKESFTASGGQIVIERNFSGGDRDFKAQLTSIRVAKPQAVFAPCYYTEAGLIALQARELGLTVPLFGGDGWESSKLVEIGGKGVEGCYFSTHYSPENASAKSKEFVAQFKKRFQETPDAMAALGYDSAMILADAIQRAGTTESKALRSALAQVKAFDAVTGRISINAKRDATKPAVILRVENGAFKFVETISP